MRRIALLGAIGLIMTAPAQAENLIVSLSNHRIQVTSNFSGEDLVLFGTIEPDGPGARLRGRYDVVADGSDNFATRYLVSDACYFGRKPLITAALGTFDGSLTTIRAHERRADGTPNPTYRCLFPEPPPPGSIPACAEAGVLGALPGVLGSLMALEVIREIVGFGENLVGRLLMIDARAMRFETLSYAWDPGNPLSGEKPTIKDLSIYK